MNRDVFRIEGPAVISFSGGRTAPALTDMTDTDIIDKLARAVAAWNMRTGAKENSND